MGLIHLLSHSIPHTQHTHTASNTANCNAPPAFKPVAKVEGTLECVQGNAAPALGVMNWSTAPTTPSQACIRATATVQAGKTMGGSIPGGSRFIFAMAILPTEMERFKAGLSINGTDVILTTW